MKDTSLVVGMDVHKESISLSVLVGDRGEARPTVKIRNDTLELKRLFGRLKKEGEIRACYEAGSCGYEVHRVLAAMKVPCDVIAPSLIPVRAGDRVKTDRRDAEKLARLYRAGELTSIRIPSEAEEALRDLVRCREDVREDVLRERDRLLKFLLRHGHTFSGGQKNWSMAHWAWLRKQTFENATAQTVFTEYLARLDGTLTRLKALDQDLAAAAEQEPFKTPVAKLRCLRGIDTLSAIILVAEICDFQRFEHPDQFMAFVGLVPSERSSGGKERRGSITKTGNGHARRVLVEAAWHYRRPPRQSGTIKKRWEGQDARVVAHAWKAQERLHRRFHRFVARGKASQVAAVAVARELCGFVWSVAKAAT
jgi:transposase